jgi:hypothetical protein
MLPKIIRPTVGDDKRAELNKYLTEMWMRAVSGRKSQVDDDYAAWNKVYEGVPLEKVRSVPFYKSSNMVVKLTRIFLDTFTARTLNIIFATRPLYVVDGLPRELKEGWELYLNRKAMYDWGHYKLCRDICQRGNKNGTAVIKYPWVEKSTWDVMPSPGDNEGYSKKQIVYYAGPDAQVVPFEDFYIYPITTNQLCDAEIKFHRLRYPEEQARRMAEGGEQAIWTLPEGTTIERYLRAPRDSKRMEQQSDAGVSDNLYRELELIECHLQYNLLNDGIFYDTIALYQPEARSTFDIYFQPYPRNHCIFTDYRPFPREDFFYGESLCQLLGQSQEEVTRIHNERRDNSTIASSVVFKRRSGSLIPNPSTNWYPGKVFDLQDMQDLDTVEVGRNYMSTIDQEDYAFQQATQLSGISEVMQGAAQGQMGKGGMYNTMGTIAVMQEGNQRQDTNIRDLRAVMSCIAQGSTFLQAHYGADDPLIDTLPDGAPDAVRQALKFFTSDKARYMYFECKPSDAGVNKEVEKANLMQMAQVLGQYGTTVQQMMPELLNPQISPGIRLVMNDIIKMHSWMAKRILKQFDEWDAVEVLPDVAAAIERVIPGGSQGTEEISKQTGTGGLGQQGGPSGGLPPVSRQQLANLASLSGKIPPGNGAPGVGPTNNPRPV